MKRFVLLLALAVAACSSETPTPSSSTAERGAVHYHLRQGTQLLSCVTWGFDTVCRNA